MKIEIKNLGAMKQAEFMLGDMTIICGSNNTNIHRVYSGEES